jgi:hypothetical protein
LYSFNQTKRIYPDRGFELTTVRVIAGGLWLYCPPLDFGQKGIEAGALKKAEPTAKMAPYWLESNVFCFRKIDR